MDPSVVTETARVPPRTTAHVLAELDAARALLERQRTRALARLDELFRSGSVPGAALDGHYAGQLLTRDLAPGLSRFFQWLAGGWMPWRGKTFDRGQERGENIFTKDSYVLARLFNSLYQGFKPDTAETYRAFAFRTYVGPGLFDSDRMVLKIDYRLKENPALTVQRVLDELVMLSDDVYLGKAHIRWWHRADRWQTVAYFMLNR